ncbi:hypothetical protein [Cellulomonas soli]|uniref:hypothetical protein n=1 Tax=Cellulomonas soli TaxID=931535 RepID=UPI0011BDAEF4|nr:hypothetical protein [Cellulomonas soli]NYI58879.1 hypothetical protein [Cellulomonas soli]
MAPTIVVAALVVCLVCTGGIVVDPGRSELVARTAWRIPSTALICSALATGLMYRTLLATAMCLGSLALAGVVLRFSPERPASTAPTYAGSRAIPPADPWVTRRNVLIYASIGLQCVAFWIYAGVR